MNLCPVYQYVNSLMCVSIRQLTFRLVPMKTTVTIEDFAFVVTASIICEGTASADVCIVPDEDGAVGIIKRRAAHHTTPNKITPASTAAPAKSETKTTSSLIVT